MCPVCLATAALIAGGAAATGKLAARRLKRSAAKQAAGPHSISTLSEEERHGMSPRSDRTSPLNFRKKRP